MLSPAYEQWCIQSHQVAWHPSIFVSTAEILSNASNPDDASNPKVGAMKIFGSVNPGEGLLCHMLKRMSTGSCSINTGLIARARS